MIKQHEKGIEYHKTCLALDNTCTRFCDKAKERKFNNQ